LRERHPRRLAALAAAGAGVTLLAAMALLAPRPLDPARLLTEPVAFSVGLLAYYAAVSVPFLLAGVAVATPLATYPHQISRLYAADLLGAALGCIGAIAALTWLDGPAALAVCAAVLVASGALYAGRGKLGAALTVLALAVLATAPTASDWIEFLPTQNKPLGAALHEFPLQFRLHHLALSVHPGNAAMIG